MASPAAGNGEPGIALLALDHDGCERGHGLGARGRDRRAGLGHQQLQAFEAGAVAHAVGEQAVALLHGALEAAEPRAVAGIEAHDQPVEKAAALGSRPGEELIHRRRHPHELDVLAERARAAGRRPVDAHDAPARSASPSAAPEARADVDGARAACARARPRSSRRRPARAPGRGRRCGAGPGPAPAWRRPRAGWSCRRRWRRSAPAARGRPRARGGDSCGNW